MKNNAEVDMKKKLLLVLGASLLLAACNDAKQESAVTPAEVEQTTQAAFEQEHSAKNSLDWSGIYVGSIPCADCSGIDVQLTLEDNGHYLYKQTYLETRDGDQTFDQEGRFTWNSKGQVVTLEGTSGGPDDEVRYFVGENVLFPANKDGKIIETGSQFDYTLHKVLPE